MQKNRESGFYNPRVFLAFVLCFGAALLALMAIAAATPPGGASQSAALAPKVISSALNGVSPAVRDLPAALPTTFSVYAKNGTRLSGPTNINQLFQGFPAGNSPERAGIEATGIPPSNDKESAILKPVSAAGYTAILRGKTGAASRSSRSTISGSAHGR